MWGGQIRRSFGFREFDPKGLRSSLPIRQDWAAGNLPVQINPMAARSVWIEGGRKGRGYSSTMPSGIPPLRVAFNLDPQTTGGIEG